MIKHLDIPTLETIISINRINDRLIVFCEHSTWELIFTGKQEEPLRLEQTRDFDQIYDED